MRPVAVTGLGIVSPLGNDSEAFFARMSRGESGVTHLDDPGLERLATRVGAACAFDGGAHFPAPRLRMLDRAAQMALVATAQALAASQGALEGVDRRRVGAFIGTGMGGAHATEDGYRTIYGEGSERVKPFSVLMAMSNAPAAWIALDHGLEGPNLTYTTACSSSAVAVGEAARRIASGEVEVMIAGGTEAPLTLGTMKAWEALRTLAPEDSEGPGRSCRPFSRDRSGLVLGEGAAVVILEDAERARRRGAPILGEIVGYGLCTDVGHITRPSVEGQAEAMRRALDDAQAAPAEVGYVNAHGTGTPANDGVETAALKKIFGDHARALAVSSTKSMHGHLLGAAGAIELAATLLALSKGIVPPTINLRVPDPECDLDYVTEGARPTPGLRLALSNSFAFGGTNAVIAVRKADG